MSHHGGYTKWRAATALMLIAALATACGGSEPGVAAPTAGGTTAGTTAETTGNQAGPVPDGDGLLMVEAARIPPAAGDAAAVALSKLAVELFQKSRPTDRNTAISPYSIYVALAMAQAGSVGATEEQLAALLGEDPAATVTAIDDALAAAVAASTDQRDQEPVEFETANSLWSEKTMQVKQPYLEALAAGFGAGMFQTDFINDPAGSKDRINSWVGDKTHQMIPKLLGDDDVTELTRAMLVNALYLSAQWDSPFNNLGDDLAFTTADGSTVQATRLLHEDHYGYASGTNWQSVTIPYVGDGMAMTIILPGKGAFDQVAGPLDPATIARAVNGTSGGEIELTIPAFKVDARTELVDALSSLGVTDLFNPDLADLSGVAGEKGDLYVTKVIHQSVVEVDENGTKAAAATALGMEAGAAPGPAPAEPEKIVVDRPFLFVIHDTVTGAPLFLGQVLDPTGE